MAIKTVLSAYRVGGPDAEDPVFAEALRETAGDPELTAWLAEEQRFDALMTDRLQQMPVPADLKELILLNSASRTNQTSTDSATLPLWRRQARTWLAMAAGLVFAFVLGRQTVPRSAVSSPLIRQSDGNNHLAMQAIAYTGTMPALQFVCFDASVVAHWVDEKSASLHMGKLIHKPMSSMQMIGSSAAEWDGKPVVMIALQNGKQMAMLYVVRAADFPGAAEETVESGGYVSRTSRTGDHLSVLTTKGARQDLAFPLPL